MKKRVLFVVSSLGSGGAQKVLADLSCMLSDSCDCDFLLNDTQDIVYEHRGNILTLNMRPAADRTNLVYAAKVLLRRCLFLRKIKKSGRYDAVVSALSSANMANCLTRTRGVKSVCTIHSHMSVTEKNVKWYKRPALHALNRYIAAHAEQIVAVSDGVREDQIRNYGVDPAKIMTVYNPLPAEKIREKAEEAAEVPWGERDTVIVTSGRLERQKDTESLIRAFGRVVRKEPEARLAILGTGSLEGRLREAAARLGLTDKIFFMGFRRNPFAILKSCGIFVLSSRMEGYPCVLCEALALGLPVVSTDCPSGPRELLAPGMDLAVPLPDAVFRAEYGILVSADETDQAKEKNLADAILTMLRPEVAAHYRSRSEARGAELAREDLAAIWLRILS